MIVELEIKDVVVPQGLLPRVITGTVEEKVKEYMEMMEQGVEFDPVLVWKRGDEYWIIDGVHRLEANKRLGKGIIRAKLVECQNELDYRIKAIQANLKHGLALAKEEKPILAQILYKEGLSEDEIQKVFGVSKSTVYAWLQNIKEEERQEKIRKALELRKRGFTQEQIAKELGVAKSTISTWLQEVQKFQTLENLNILDPQVGNITQEGYKALSRLIVKLGVDRATSKEVCEELGFGEVAQELIQAFRILAEKTKEHLRKLPSEADDSMVRKWANSMSEIQKLEPEARRIWIERAVEWWKKLQREKEKEKHIVEAAKRLLVLPEYIFSSWRSVRADLRYSRYISLSPEEKEAIYGLTEEAIDNILRKHADELMAVYEQIPEATEELIQGLLDVWDRELTYEEFVKELHQRGYRAPYGIYRYYKELQTSSTLPPSPPLAGSEPALSPEEEDQWIKGWEEAVREEEEKKKEQKKKAKEEEEQNPIIRDYMNYREQMMEMVIQCSRKHGVVRTLKLLDEIREWLEEEGKSGILKDWWEVW